MANKQRGYVTAEINSQSYTLRLTLNALAEIEEALGAGSIEEIGEILERPRAKDLRSVLAALIRGGGHDVTDEDVGQFDLDNSINEAIQSAMNAGAPEKTGGGSGQGKSGGTSKPKGTSKKKGQTNARKRRG